MVRFPGCIVPTRRRDGDLALERVAGFSYLQRFHLGFLARVMELHLMIIA